MINKHYLDMLSHRSVIRNLSEYATARGKEIGYENVFDFSLGNPSVPAPQSFTDTAIRFLETMEPCILDLEPAAVFLNIGTNDMNGADYVLPEFLERYERIVRSILQKLPGVKLYLLAFYPVNQAAAPPEAVEAFRYRTNERVQEANHEIQKLADRYHAEYLDLNAGLRDEAGSLRKELTIDGVHMHVEGYRIVLDNLLPVLEELVRKMEAN